MKITKFKSRNHTQGTLIEIPFNSLNKHTFYDLFFKEKSGTLLIFSKLQNNNRAVQFSAEEVSAIVFDIDKGENILYDTKDFLDELGYSYMIVSSKNHAKIKRKLITENGIKKFIEEPPYDRFHIIFPFREPVKINSEDDHIRLERLYNHIKKILETIDLPVDKMVSYKRGKQGIFVSTNSNNPHKYFLMKEKSLFVDDILDKIETPKDKIKGKQKELTIEEKEKIRKEEIERNKSVFFEIKEKLDNLKELYRKKGVYYDKDELKSVLGTDNWDYINFYKAMEIITHKLYNRSKVIRLKYLPTLLIEMMKKNEELKKKIDKAKKSDRPIDDLFRILLNDTEKRYTIKDPLRIIVEGREDQTPSATLYISYNRLTKRNHIVIYSHKYGILLEVDHIWMGKLQQSNLYITDFILKYEQNDNVHIIEKKYKGYLITDKKLKKKQLGGKNILRTLYNIYGENIKDEDYIQERLKYIYKTIKKEMSLFNMKAYKVKILKRRISIKDITKNMRKGMRNTPISGHTFYGAARYVIMRKEEDWGKDFKARKGAAERLKHYFYTFYKLGFYKKYFNDYITKFKYVFNRIVMAKIGKIYEKFKYMKRLSEEKLIKYYLEKFKHDTYKLAKEMLYTTLYINLYRINSINIKLFDRLKMYIHSRRNAYIHYLNTKNNFEFYSWYPSISNVKKVSYAIVKLYNTIIMSDNLRKMFVFIVEFFNSILWFFKKLMKEASIKHLVDMFNVFYFPYLNNYVDIDKHSNKMMNLNYKKIFT